MDSLAKFAIEQQQPFCWQSKAARRFIRDVIGAVSSKRKMIGGMLAVYTALTELASNEETSHGDWDQHLIAMTAGMSRPTVRKCLRLLIEHGIVIERKNRRENGWKMASTLWLPDHGNSPIAPKEKSFPRESEPKEKSFPRVADSTTGGVPVTPGAEPKEKSLHAVFFQHIEKYKPLKDKPNLSKGGQMQRERIASPQNTLPKAFPGEFKERWEAKYQRLGIEYPYSSRDAKAFPMFEVTWAKLSDELKPWIIKSYLQNDFQGWVKQFHPFWGMAEHLMRFLEGAEKLRGQQVKIDNALKQPTSAPPPEMPVSFTREQVDRAPKWLQEQISKYGGAVVD